MIKHVLFLTALLMTAPVTAATDATETGKSTVSHPTVSLSARALRTVQNDTATAGLFVEREDSDAAKASPEEARVIDDGFGELAGQARGAASTR